MMPEMPTLTTSLSLPLDRQSSTLYEKLFLLAAFIKKDCHIALTYKLQFAFQFLQVFFSVALIYCLGKMFSSSGSSAFLAAYQAEYFPFALIGLALNSYCRAGLINLTNNFRQIMTEGTLEPMCAAPVSYPCLLLGSSLWHFVFKTIRVAFYFLLAVTVFGLRLPHANWPLALLVIGLSLPVFLMFGLISSSILVVIKRGDPVNWVFSSLAGFLAGTMFPLSVLPDWLQACAWCLPLTHVLEAARRALLCQATFNDVSSQLLALLLFTLILLPITRWIVSICMRRARKLGAFSNY